MSDLERRRAAKAAAAVVATKPQQRRTKAPTKGGEEKAPPLWRWFSAQTAHSDPAKAKCARVVRERWALAATPFGKIDRSLAGEDSEYLVAFRQLLDEYRVLYEIPDSDDSFAREVGSAGPLIPTYVDLCRHCGRETIPGTDLCGRHGGQWVSAKDAADISRRLHDKLLTAGESAVRVLLDLMDNGRSEQVRMMAATAVLDRAGIGPNMNVHHSGEITVSSSDAAADALRARLDRIAANISGQTADPLGLESGEEIVEAEVVDTA